MAYYGPLKEHKDVRITFTLPYGLYLALGEEGFKRGSGDANQTARIILMDYLTGSMPKASADRPGVVSI